jgi:hypothetical protein
VGKREEGSEVDATSDLASRQVDDATEVQVLEARIISVRHSFSTSMPFSHRALGHHASHLRP